jgi:alpha-glucosidase
MKTSIRFLLAVCFTGLFQAGTALAAAAREKLMVDLHGAYKPTGLARTWPNFITQEGVLGNEYNKIRPGACTTLHTVTLPFTRGLLGPMDFTPGGFLNRTAAAFKVTQPAEVIGTRARQLAEAVVYFSPLLCLCDSPANYRGQPGVEFFRGLPTVWDDTVVLAAEVAQHIVIARRSGSRWYLAAMNGDSPLTLQVPLKFLGAREWKLRAYADAPESAAQPEKISDTTRQVSATETLELTLAPAGGYAAVLSAPRGLVHPYASSFDVPSRRWWSARASSSRPRLRRGRLSLVRFERF